ncbi:MAG: DUF1015 domain-containing protein [Ruminococcaceae bacterium]|nr:DUF1015 domain-containing protein [Oscillospiraceae bacterium]
MPIFNKAKMLLPNNIDFSKWSVVACDQYTSEPKYWEDAKLVVGNNPSALNIIFPEIFLNDPDKKERVKNINQAMDKYIEQGVLKETEPCLIYVERTLKNKTVRRGIMGVVDLEEYDFNKGSTSKIRATEGTVLERIPPRVEIRENASLELPHIMLLIDDDKKEIIEPLSEIKESFEKVYDFELMLDSGSIKGYKIDDKKADEIIEKLEKFGDKELFKNKYNVDKEVLMYAVGDGNHSLATAKTCYENLKKKVGKENAICARFALLELVNLHDDSLEFEAIHRVVFGVDTEKIISELKSKYNLTEGENDVSFEIVTKDGIKSYIIENPDFNLTVGCIQSFIDSYLSKNEGEVDYIHGEDVVKNLSQKENNVGIILKSMLKTDLFKTVILDGALPRKTFSMGEACDKRFYLEGRKIK